MRLVFVDNLLFQVANGRAPRFNMEPHLGLMSLVAIARREGHEAVIYDPKQAFVTEGRQLDASAIPFVAARILERAPDVVGFTALACNFLWVARLAAEVRARLPHVPILLGGPHASILHREILQGLSCFDVVVRHEAESTLPPLLQRLESGSFEGLRGVSYRDQNGRVVVGEAQGVVEELDGLPMPAFDCYPLADLGEPAMRIDAGRGCPFACTFCSTATFFGRSYRLKSPARLLAEMDLLRDRCGFQRFKLNHDLFTVDRRKVRAFCQAVVGKGYTWSCSARVDCVDEELLEEMYAAGCRGIYFGIETGSRRMQRVSQKRLDLDLVEPTVAITERLGIATTTSFIVGFPEEERADQEATVDMAARLHCRSAGGNVSQVHLLAPEPGTAMMAQFREQLAYDGHISTFNVPALDPGDEALLRVHPDLFASYWYYRGCISREESIRVSAAWVELANIDRPILSRLVAAFEGSLYRLIAEAHALADGSVLDGLVAAVEARVGALHPLVSVARYIVAARGLAGEVGPKLPETEGAETEGTETEGQEEQVLTLSPRARLLRDIHDCPQLLGRMRAHPEATAFEEDGERTNLVLLGRVGRNDEADIGVFHADGVTADLIARFSSPRSYWGLCATLVHEEAVAMPDWTDIRGLRDLGVLAPFAPASS